MTNAIAPTKPNNIKTDKHPPAATKTSQRNPRKKVSPAPVVHMSKQDMVIAMLKQSMGVTITDLTIATGWQAHSIRGVISAVLKKKLNLNIVSERSAEGLRRYRIAEMESV